MEPIIPPANPTMWGVLPTSITDRNGNQLTQSSSGYKDPTGRVAVSWTSVGSSNGDQINIAGLSGPITVKWTTTPVSFPETGYNIGTWPDTCSLGGGTTNSASVVSEIDLPNGQKYSFLYDGTYGRVSRITFPDGGYVRYVWGLYTSAKTTHASWNQNGNPASCDFVFDIPAITDRYVSYDGSTEVLHQQFSYALPTWSGGNNNTWSAKQTTVTSTDSLTGQVTKTVHSYKPATTDNNVYVLNALYSLQAPVETNVLYEDGNGKIYKEVNKSWLNPHTMLAEQTILYDSSGNRNVGSATLRCYDANEQVTNAYEYGFQSEGSYPSDQSCYSSVTKIGSLNNSYTGPLRRQTATAHHPFFTWNGGTPPTWSGTHIVNAPDIVTVADGSNVTASQTLFAYDGNSLQPSGAINLSNPGTTRANITSLQHLISGSTYAKTTYSYFDTGQVQSMTDSCGNAACSDMTGSNHTTTYSYADNYASGTGTPAGQTNAYLTQVTYPNTGVAHVESFTWGFNDALLRSHTDQNNQVTTYTYNTPPSGCSFSDGLNRLSSVTYPDGGKATYCYNDSPFNSSTPSPSFTTTRAMTSSTSLTSLTAFDGLGHTVESAITSDTADCPGTATDRTDTTYDGFGRPRTVSNPYCMGRDTVYTTGYTYDPLGRTTQVTHPDSNTVLTSYSGPATQVQDEGNGNQRVTRISQVDGLGRLSSICEVATGPFVGSGGASSSTLIGQNGSPAACGLNISGTGFLTSYTYDALDNLTGVAQSSVARSFNYDSLSRLTSAANPESGTTTYAYDANGNLSTKTAPAPNQTGTATVTTSYQYDALNRLTQKSYSDGTTPTATFYFDKDPGGRSYANLNGRLFESTVPSQLGLCCIATFQQYDAMGRTSEQWQYLPTGCACDYSLPYTYDLMGNMLTSTDPYGNSFTYGYNGAGRITSVTGSYSDANDPANLLSAMHYNAAGQPISDQLGDDGEVETYTYTNRNQLQAMSAVNGSTPIYNYSLTFAPNGSVLAANDSVNGNWNYSYDQFNRLVCASVTSNTACAFPPTGTPTYTYVYDRFGNRWQQNGSYSMQLSFTGNGSTNNNRMDGHSYDSAGNLLNDGTHQYFYDAENRLIQVDGTAGTCTSGSTTGTTACYYYDAEGHRVWRTGFTADSCDSTGKRGYVFDLAGHVIVENNSSGTGCQGQVYVGERHFGRQGGGTFFYHADWLGTVRFINSDGYPTQGAETCTSLPFGDGLSCNSTYGNVWHFTGKERDSESGLDNFGARYDASNFGRFLTTDPVVITTERLMNPQQLNLYAHVANNPLRFIDPTGEILQCVGNVDQQKQCFADVQRIAGDAASGLSMDAKTGVISFDTKGVDLSKNEGAALVNDLVGSKNTYDFSIGPTIMTDKGPMRIDTIGPELANLPAFGDQHSIGNPPSGVSDIVGLYLDNPHYQRASNTSLEVAPEWTVAFHELAEAFEKIDAGKGGSYEAGHNAALQRELKLRDQRPYLKGYNTGAGGPANSRNPEGSIIKK